MTEMEAAADRSALVTGAHRLIRAVDSAEGPFSGALISYGDGVAVCVDTAELSGWDGWAFSEADHICGVIDLRRRADGHDALLPWCTQRVETFLGRRRVADIPLTPGELGTLVASLLRGIRELTGASDSPVGEWWLTGDGRPLFVHGDGGDARARTAALVERVVDHTNDRATLRVLEEILTALRERRHHADDDVRWEEHLFTVAAPRALRLDVFAPEKAADLVPRRTLQLEPVDRRSSRRRARSSTERAGARSTLEAIRAEFRERSQALLSRLPRRDRGVDSGRAPNETRDPKRSRRRPLILAGSLAAVVLVVGLMWPEGSEPDPASAAARESAEDVATEPDSGTEPDSEIEPDSATAPDSDTVSDVAPEKAPVESPSPPPPVDGEDALVAVPILLDAVSACAAAGAEACPDALAGGLATPADGLVTHGAEASSATLVDDYGDVVVVKLAPVHADGTVAEQMLVLERQEQKWLVRDIYDVAHQPG